jgi:hypothetical protein
MDKETSRLVYEIPADKNTADILTTPLLRIELGRFRKQLGVISLEEAKGGGSKG